MSNKHLRTGSLLPGPPAQLYLRPLSAALLALTHPRPQIMSDLLNKAKCVTQTESAFAKCAIWAHRDASPPTHHPSLPPARDAELPLGAVCIHDLVVGVDDSEL